MEVRARRVDDGMELTCRICEERLALAQGTGMYDPMNGFLREHRHCQPPARHPGPRPARQRSPESGQ